MGLLQVRRQQRRQPSFHGVQQPTRGTHHDHVGGSGWSAPGFERGRRIHHRLAVSYFKSIFLGRIRTARNRRGKRPKAPAFVERSASRNRASSSSRTEVGLGFCVGRKWGPCRGQACAA